MSLIEPFIAELRHEAATTRRLLERVPEESFAWKPHEKSMTLGRLASHIAELYSFATPISTQDEVNFAEETYEPFTPAGVNELLEAFDKNVAEAIEVLRTQSDERLGDAWRLRAGDQVFFEMSRAKTIRFFMFDHLVHHRGQLSVYMRLLNVPLPSIYGPTADEAA